MYDDSDYIYPSKHDLLNLCRYIYIYIFSKQKTNRDIIQPYVA